jgi:hypothetical protein
VAPIYLLAGQLTLASTLVVPKAERLAPSVMRRWIAGSEAPPSADPSIYFELIPDPDRLARQRRGLQHLRQCFEDYEDAVKARDGARLVTARRDMLRELQRQEDEFDREEQEHRRRREE